MMESLLDADFNLGNLPREKVNKALQWFLKTYLPAGDVTLQPIPVEARVRPSSRVLRQLESRYSPEISAIPRNVQHSIKELSGYLEFLIGPELLPLLLDQKTLPAFFMTGIPETAGILSALGYDRIFQVNACGWSRRHRVVLGFNPRRNAACLVQCAFHSDDQLLNHQARLYQSRRSDQAPEQELVLVLRQPGVTGFPARDALEQLLVQRGEVVDTLFIGFTNPLKSYLDDVQTLSFGDLELKTGYFTDIASKSRHLVLALSAFGANYGTLPAELVKVLARFGLRRVVLVGTGGGISGPRQRFGWVAPDEVWPTVPGCSDQLPTRFVNQAKNLFLPFLVRGGRHVSVISPLAETQAEVRRLRKLEVVAVDCELAHVVLAIADLPKPPKLWALINITDFPLASDHEKAIAEGGISLENSGRQYRAVESALRVLVEALKRDQAGAGTVVRPRNQ